ncbi:MAG: hypothetical protein SCH98_08380 [Deferrisomatales bacterium]|nr:hypothetical protein [Deferrisomatales bacterium]
MDGPRSLVNAWKRRGVFACTHDAHEDFEGSVSPHHVLREKRCYPQGCLYFRWRCRRLEKGQPCKRKFTAAGRLCRGCREYEEEKVHQQPRLLLTPGEWYAFRRELEELEDWFDRTAGREVEVSAEVVAVKPSFVREVDAGSRIRFRGFLAVLRDAYLGRTLLRSPVYLRASRGVQERHGLRAGDVLDFRATVREDRGRLVLDRPRALEVLSRGPGEAWTFSAGLAAKHSATAFRRQPERCLLCPGGTLLDVHQETRDGVRHYRRLLCLEGAPEPGVCAAWGDVSAV